MLGMNCALLSRGGMVRAIAVAAMMLACVRDAGAGFVINPTFDSSITTLGNANQVIKVINQAIANYQSKLTDNITVNITFTNMTSGLGQSQKPIYTLAYYNYLNALTKDATSANDTTALAHLPTTYLDPVLGNSQMYITQANLKALGYKVGNTYPDGIIGLNTSQMFTDTIGVNSSNYDMFAVVSHEINEVLGLGSAVGFNRILPEDLFRYDANGQRSFTTSSSAASYFSIDGTTLRARFNQRASGDYGDWYSGVVAVTPQVQDAFATPGVVYNRAMTNEFMALDVIGYNVGLQNKTLVSGLGGATFSFMRTTHDSLPNPEPSTILLTVLGGLGFGGTTILRRRRAAASRP